MKTQRYRPKISSTSRSIAALPSSDVNVKYVSSHVHVRIYVGSGRRVGNFLNTAQSLHYHLRPGLGWGACVGEQRQLEDDPAETEDGWTPAWHEQVPNLTVKMSVWMSDLPVCWAFVCNRGVCAVTAREGELMFAFKMRFVLISMFVCGTSCYLRTGRRGGRWLVWV